MRAVLGAALALGLGLAGAGPGAADPPPAAPFAEVLTAENVAARQPRGPDAIAGLGDFVLGNGVVCAAVSAPDHESTLSDRGGVLIDLGFCDRADDQWGVLQPMLNLSRSDTLRVETVEPEVVDGVARVVARGRVDGLEFATVYALDPAAPDRLRIETTIERRAEGEALFLLGDVVLHGHRQLTAFTLSESDPAQSVGFTHPAIEIDSAFSMVDAMVRAETQVLVGGSRLLPGIAYGWRIVSARVERRDGTHDPLAHLAMNGEHFSILGVYTDTLLFGGVGRPGMLELAQTLLMDLVPGDRVVYVREIVLGDRADVASVTDRLWPDGPLVTGRVGDPDARLHVTGPGDVPVTFVRPLPDGRFAFRLPARRPGRYTVRTRVGDAGEVARTVVDPVDGATIDLGRLDTPPLATLLLPRGETMRLVVNGVPPTPDPRLGADGIDFRVGAQRIASSTESNDLALAGVPSDPLLLRLPAGRYRVLATRGPEWSVSEVELELPAGERRPLEIPAPVRVVEPDGQVSADLHVHAAPSDDSALPVRDRIRSFVAMGADVIVATEHDHVYDYAPVIAAMGLGDRLASLVGTEVTSTVIGDAVPYTSGHANAFPLVVAPEAYRRGAPDAENRRLRDVVRALRARPGRPILQLNHPRESGADRGLGSYLSHLGVQGQPFDPRLSLAAPANAAFAEADGEPAFRDIDFDAVELLNANSMDAYRRTRADWLSWLLQGERRTGTANSDSHSADHPVALPRNYVAYSGGRGAAFDRAAFMAALRAGRVVGTTGPLLDVRLGDAGPGGLFRGREGALRVTVRRADWVPVDEARVYVNGVLAARAPVPADGALRFPLRFAGDAFVTVEVEGAAAPGSVSARVAPGFTPFAFSNPIYVDADDAPGWSAPGLPASLPPALADPLARP